MIFDKVFVTLIFASKTTLIKVIILCFLTYFNTGLNFLRIEAFLVAESATIETAFRDVCLKVRKSGSL